MFDWLYDLLGMLMSFFNSITGSYALALLLYALVFKIVFLPFSIKQQQNQIKMAQLQPKVEIIRAKYKGRTDQASMQKQQEEIMELQQKEGYSAMSGCLPMLIQLPIIMLLYAIVQSPLSYIAQQTDLIKDYNANYSDSSYVVPEEILSTYGDDIYKRAEGSAELVLDDNGNPTRVAIDPIAKLYEYYGITKGQRTEIQLIGAIFNSTEGADEASNQRHKDYIERIGIDYETIPSFRVFGINLAETPSFANPSVLLIIPFLAAAASYVSMILTRKFNGGGAAAQLQGQDDQTKKSMGMMDLVMPLMTLWIAFNFSGMLGLYWVYQSLLGLLQSFILAKAMPLPTFTEEEIREIRRQEKEAEKQARNAAKNARHRSLHYIDEDDYDELPEAPQNDAAKKRSTNLGGIDAPEIKD